MHLIIPQWMTLVHRPALLPGMQLGDAGDPCLTVPAGPYVTVFVTVDAVTRVVVVVVMETGTLVDSTVVMTPMLRLGSDVCSHPFELIWGEEGHSVVVRLCCR